MPRSSDNQTPHRARTISPARSGPAAGRSQTKDSQEKQCISLFIFYETPKGWDVCFTHLTPRNQELPPAQESTTAKRDRLLCSESLLVVKNVFCSWIFSSLTIFVYALRDVIAWVLYYISHLDQMSVEIK